jgi:exodeoxyribonuclease V alpha subunit
LIVARLALALGNERDKAVKEVRFARLSMTGSQVAATGFEAKSIHRLLEVDLKSGGFRRREDNPSRDPRRRRAR